MAPEPDVTDLSDQSGGKPSWWKAYADEVLSKSKKRSGRTAIYGRWLTLRIMPSDMREKHHRELFDDWGEAGKPLFEAYEPIGKHWDEAYGLVPDGSAPQ